MHIANKEQERRELLAAGDYAEFGRLLDRVGGVSAGVGEPDHFCLRGLRLQQEGREVGCVERMSYSAKHLAAIGGNDRGSIAFERVAEGIIGGQEKPAVATSLGQRLAGAVGEHVGVVV